MAIFNNIAGAETGGLEDVYISTGTVTADAAVKRTANYSYKVTGVDAEISSFSLLVPNGGTSDGSTAYATGFGIYIGNTTPAAVFSFLLSVKSDMRLRLDTNGDVLIVDRTQTTVVGTISAPFTNNTWHYVCVYYERSASGACKVWIDGALKISLAGKDFVGTSGSSFFSYQTKQEAAYNINYDDCYIYSNATETQAHINFGVYAYQNAKASATPDVGNNLNTGTWATMGETPVNDTNAGIYTGTPLSGVVDYDDGSKAGPNGDARLTGTLVGAKYVWRAKRGGGGATTHSLQYGNNVDGATSTNTVINSAYTIHNYMSVSASVVPLVTEYFRQGFGVSCPQDLTVSEMWAQLGHVPPPPPPPSGVGASVSKQVMI